MGTLWDTGRDTGFPRVELSAAHCGSNRIQAVLQVGRYGNIFSLFLAASGVFAFFIHSYFILNGRSEFTLPVSMVLLVLILIVSLAQGLIMLDELYAKRKRRIK
jgi:hypothetical protein